MRTSRYLAGAIAFIGAIALTACAASGGGASGPVGIGEIVHADHGVQFTSWAFTN